MPNNLVANVQGKSSIARAGLAVHLTAPIIHPGFSGPIALELYNHGPWTLEFFPGDDLICQIAYTRVTSAAAQKIATAIGSYVGQKTPFPAKKT